VLAAGPLIAMLVGAGAGAVAGGIIGALVDAGVPEEDAKLYEEGIRRGGTLLMVRADNNIAQRAAQIMNQAGAVDVKRRSTEWRTGARHMNTQQQTAQRQTPPQPGERTTQREGEIRVPVVEEELKVGKREEESRGVRVQSKVTEKPVEKQVQLHEEHVNVERRPTDRPATQADLSGQRGETFEVREHREEPVVQKTARVVEEVVVSKEERDRTEKIRDTVRRKDVEIQPIGGQRGEDDSDFRNNFRTVYANTGMRYEQYAPAYQYGSQLRSNQQYSGRDWDTIETDVRRDWESRNPGSSWERMKNAVRYGWERVKQSV
jgi:stress response protein YsnF